jgi:hypothetical protein
MRAHLSAMCKFHARKTANMATQSRARNATKSELRKKVGTKLESLPRFSGEYFCVSGGYGRDDFFKRVFLIPQSSCFGARGMRAPQHDDVGGHHPEARL